MIYLAKTHNYGEFIEQIKKIKSKHFWAITKSKYNKIEDSIVSLPQKGPNVKFG